MHIIVYLTTKLHHQIIIIRLYTFGIKAGITITFAFHLTIHSSTALLKKLQKKSYKLLVFFNSNDYDEPRCNAGGVVKCNWYGIMLIWYCFSAATCATF